VTGTFFIKTGNCHTLKLQKKRSAQKAERYWKILW